MGRSGAMLMAKILLGFDSETGPQKSQVNGYLENPMNTVDPTIARKNRQTKTRFTDLISDRKICESSIRVRLITTNKVSSNRPVN